MKFGLFAINMGPCSDPVTAVRVAQAAEAAGFESVWTGEHIVLPDPDPQVPASPVPHGIGHQSRRRLAQHLDPKSARSEEHTSELQSQFHLVCRLLLEKKKKQKHYRTTLLP